MSIVFNNHELRIEGIENITYDLVKRYAHDTYKILLNVIKL